MNEQATTSNNSIISSSKSPLDNNNITRNFIEAMNNNNNNDNNNNGKQPMLLTGAGGRANTVAPERPHFRIDWRQLTYFQKNSSFICSSKKSSYLQTTDDSQTVGFVHTTNPLANKQKHQAKRILNSLDGCFKSGQLNAILGPSGAGKTTFLSALFGDKQESSYGQTKVTWFEDARHERPLLLAPSRPIRIAFLPQHDHLLHHLTVYETLMFASKIKNPNASNGHRIMSSISGNRKRSSKSPCQQMKNFHHHNVKRVAKMLKLNDCFDTRCGSLSGGQYKRVSIGQELLSEPDVIILDEPTSGLDAMTCLTTIKTLKSIAIKHPISIVLTIHQPDIDVFNLFDKVYVIAQGGSAIYEGPPQDIVSTLEQVNLKMPSASYNPARFIVENAFIVDPAAERRADLAELVHLQQQQHQSGERQSGEKDATGDRSSSSSSPSDESDDDDDDDDDGDDDDTDNRSADSPLKQTANYMRNSLISLSEAISGKEIQSPDRAKGKDKRPLLNIGIRTSDGKLITSEQLMLRNKNNNHLSDSFVQMQSERLHLLKRLNEIQKSKYHGGDLVGGSDIWSSASESSNSRPHSTLSSAPGATQEPHQQQTNQHQHHQQQQQNNNNKSSSAKSDYSSHGGWSESASKATDSSRCSTSEPPPAPDPLGPNGRPLVHVPARGKSLASLVGSCPSPGSFVEPQDTSRPRVIWSRSLQVIPQHADESSANSTSSTSSSSSSSSNETGFVVNFDEHDDIPASGLTDVAARSSTLSSRVTTTTNTTGAIKRPSKLRRQFDKRLSAKHNCSKQRDFPILYHSMLLTHRTWLSIIRDPIFFGIQFCMHTTIPILLALIFGSVQDEACPRVGHFDLVDFAYSDSENLIQATVKSIRMSVGNIGIVFFEMFVLCFAINCITALVFPLDMYVLLKEYRNGWYSLRSYFFGRTLADLPLPILLHSMAMTILYFMTGQPLSLWRLSAIILVVILASLVAQSVGLTIGALLMRSSQSAVLAAAAIVAPFFALSGFIVRIHMLPWVAQMAAKASYLYHLLNGFIILRYGFGRCPCTDDDFEPNRAHQIPANLHTLASMWIGTYSDEYSNSKVVQQASGHLQSAQNNRTNIDPNIDVVDKMLTAFKMANSYGHQMQTCDDVIPYAMLDFNLREQDVIWSVLALVIMLIISRIMTFAVIYFKIRSFS